MKRIDWLDLNWYIEFRRVLISRMFTSREKLTGIYLLKVNNRNTRTRCEVCSKLTTEHWADGFFCLEFFFNFSFSRLSGSVDFSFAFLTCTFFLFCQILYCLFDWLFLWLVNLFFFQVNIFFLFCSPLLFISWFTRSFPLAITLN